MEKVVVLGRAARLQLSLTAEQHQLFLAGKDYKIISEYYVFIYHLCKSLYLPQNSQIYSK